MENDITTGEALAALGITAAIGGLGLWYYRRSQKSAPLTMLNTDQLAHLAQLPEPEEEQIILTQLTEEEEQIRLALTPEEEKEEQIRLAKLSLREQRRTSGGITIL